MDKIIEERLKALLMRVKDSDSGFVSSVFKCAVEDNLVSEAIDFLEAHPGIDDSEVLKWISDLHFGITRKEDLAG